MYAFITQCKMLTIFQNVRLFGWFCIVQVYIILSQSWHFASSFRIKLKKNKIMNYFNLLEAKEPWFWKRKKEKTIPYSCWQIPFVRLNLFHSKPIQLFEYTIFWIFKLFGFLNISNPIINSKANRPVCTFCCDTSKSIQSKKWTQLRDLVKKV